jgi:hypothetical protein
MSEAIRFARIDARIKEIRAKLSRNRPGVAPTGMSVGVEEKTAFCADLMIVNNSSLRTTRVIVDTSKMDRSTKP